jgi:organic radical activating enzyme
MFGKNEIVGQKYFKDAEEDKLFVTSMFMTLQGEGPFRGEPAFFIRLAKCNLACSFCDTFFDDGDWMTFDEVDANIETAIDKFYSDKGMNRPDWTLHDPLTGIKKQVVLVMTGGEPLLQKNIGPLLERMNKVFKNTQIESNGIVHQSSIPKTTVLVMSPKCIEKGGMMGKYIKPHKDNMIDADCLKFVMEADPDSPYSSIPEWAQEWHEKTNKPIYISPMNVYNDEPIKSKELRNSGANRIEIGERSTVDEVISFWEPGLLDMDANQRNHEYAAQYCIEHGYVLNLQIHLYASLA